MLTPKLPIAALLAMALLVGCGREPQSEESVAPPQAATSHEASHAEIQHAANQPPAPGHPAHQNPSVLTLRGRFRGNADHGDNGTFYVSPGEVAELVWFYPVSVSPQCTLKEGESILYSGTDNKLVVGAIHQRRNFQVICPLENSPGSFQNSTLSVVPYSPLVFLETTKHAVQPGESFVISWATTAVSACELSNTTQVLIPMGQVSLIVGRRSVVLYRSEVFTLRCTGMAPRTQSVTVN